MKKKRNAGNIQKPLGDTGGRRGAERGSLHSSPSSHTLFARDDLLNPKECARARKLTAAKKYKALYSDDQYGAYELPARGWLVSQAYIPKEGWESLRLEQRKLRACWCKITGTLLHGLGPAGSPTQLEKRLYICARVYAHTEAYAEGVEGR